MPIRANQQRAFLRHAFVTVVAAVALQACGSGSTLGPDSSPNDPRTETSSPSKSEAGGSWSSDLASTDVGIQGDAIASADAAVHRDASADPVARRDASADPAVHRDASADPVTPRDASPDAVTRRDASPDAVARKDASVQGDAFAPLPREFPGSGSGYNTSFITRLLTQTYGHCGALCSTNHHPMTFQEIEAAFAPLRDSSLDYYREIVTMAILFPDKGKVQYLAEVLKVLQLYQAAQTSVILTFGIPPRWMNPDAWGWCMAPDSDESWKTSRTNISRAIGDLIRALWQSGQLSHEWMDKHLLIDPINEFDSMLTPGGQCKHVPANANGVRAADLSNGIVDVLKSYNIPVEVLMPSSVSARSEYFTQYYEAGGQGRPNVHLYNVYEGAQAHQPKAVASWLESMRQTLRRINGVIPPKYRNHLIIGEAGNAEPSAIATPDNRPGRLFSGTALQVSNRAFFTDPEIRRLTDVRLLWTLTDIKETPFNSGAGGLAETHPWELTHGNMTTELVPKASLYQYLKDVDGVDLINDERRLLHIRSTIRRIFAQTQSRAPTPEETAVALKALILNKVTLSELTQRVRRGSLMPAGRTSKMRTRYTELKLLHDGCDGTTRWGAPCNSAIHRYCLNRGYIGGMGPMQSANDDLIVVCVAASGGTGFTQDWAQISDHFAGCDASCATSFTDACSAACRTASHRYCNTHDQTSGFGPVELGPQGLMGICVKPAAAVGVSTTFTNLASFNSACTGSGSNAPTRLACRTAAGEFCQSATHVDGYGPVEHDGNTAIVICLKQ